MKILLVDDSRQILDAVSLALKDGGYFTKTAQSASDALNELETPSPSDFVPFDLVITDYSMPGGMNGLELSQEIRNAGFQMPIILFSGSNIDKEIAKLAGITEVISKSFDELLRAIENLNKK